MRYPILNVSGLSRAGYDIFTSSLRSLALIANVKIDDDDEEEEGDTYYDDVEINVQVAKNWFQSQYRHIPVSVIEQIMRILLLSVERDTFLVGSDFFAALRLVIHAENGMKVKPELILEQTKPSYSSHYSTLRKKREAPEASLLEGPRQKKLRPVSLSNRVTLAYNDPLRCVRCIKANIECRINPEDKPVLLEWRKNPEWTPRPRYTACLHCDSWAKSCRLSGMVTKDVKACRCEEGCCCSANLEHETEESESDFDAEEDE